MWSAMYSGDGRDPALPKGGVYGTALQAAAAGGHKDVVKMLLEAGADVNAEGGRSGCW
jgi:ankyrin repeat protein